MHIDNAITDRPAKSPTAEQFAALVARLRRTNDELNHFVRALSHDMGANLMLLEGSLSRLKRSLGKGRPPAADENFVHVEACLRQSRRLLRDMVELGRTGSVCMEPKQVDLASVLKEVLFEQRELLAGRSVDVRIDSPLPVFHCNEDRLKQIVVNLVRNAVTHGCDRCDPRITISSCPAGSRSNGDRLAGFRVHDNGPGIPIRFREDIFLPGLRLPGTASEGSGMGLAIVRKIARLYGGDVFVDPECASGTAFVVCLPTSPSDGQLSGDRPATPHTSHSPRPHDVLKRKISRHGRR